MGEPPCDVLDVELALELLEAELATELPAHMRAFARAHADGRPTPSAPLIGRLASSMATARNACRHPILFDRGLAMLRLVAPLVIEAEPAVAAARAAPMTWDNLAVLARAREAAAQARFGIGAIALMHLLHGVGPAPAERPGAPVEGWKNKDRAVDRTAIEDAWGAIATRFALAGTVRIDRATKPDVRPRTFVIEPKVEVIVVLPPVIDTPAARFAVLHELGHAAAALSLPAGVPRVLDEAAAAYIARLAEPPSWLPPAWESELAVAARGRRSAIASLLDEVERALPDIPDPPPAATPPWALWHDPGAQAAYVAAEGIAEALRRDLGPKPPRGELGRSLVIERGRIDRRTKFEPR